MTGIVCIVVDRLLGGSGVAGAAASSTAGNATGTPQAIALADHSYAAIAPVATVQVAASVIVTAMLTPMLTAWVSRRAIKKQMLLNTQAAAKSSEPLNEGMDYPPRAAPSTHEA